MIPFLGEASVRNVMHLIVVCTSSVYIEDAEYRAYVATCERIERVESDHAVNDDAVGVHL